MTQQQNLLKTLRENLVIIVLFTSIIGAWYTMSGRIDRVEAQANKNETQLALVTNQYNSLNNEVNARLTRIETNIENLTNLFKGLDLTYKP